VDGGLGNVLKKLSLIALMTIIASCGSPAGGDPVDGVATGDHRIFVTSQKNSGNFGGLASADSFCQTAALNAGLSRTYKAIMSDATNSAKDRLTLLGAVYIFESATNRSKVVDLGVDLWSSTLLRPIDRDENFNTYTGQVWTGTQSEGTTGIASSCSSWTSDSSGDSGTVGDTAFSDDRYIELGMDQPCDELKPIYCISQ
tara:strand:+ start:91327 stop:91926 length:600 start_codon:yes stop_codon:yes gene_type:complete